ncbi:MAG: hypothetical protein JW910_21875, partial [Anaerolineae bacterium]|nr:hypothetical protein [Anaerolineae bacterium]
MPQDSVVADGLLWTAMVDNGEIWLCNSFQEAAQPTLDGSPLACDGYCRPALTYRNANNLVIFYTASPGTDIHMAEVDLALFASGTPECAISDMLIYAPGKYCSLHALSPNLVMALYVDNGGVGVARLENTAGVWAWEAWGYRFIFPTDNFSEGDSGARAWLNYSAVAQLDDDIFVYLSSPDGNVAGVILHTGQATWSDSFEAAPGDKSRFAVGNAFVYNGSIYLCGQFQRVDEDELFISTYVYGLLLSSTDGKTFALDRFTAFTGGDTEDADCPAFRYFAHPVVKLDSPYGVDGDAILYSDANRWMALPMHFGFTGETKGLTISPIVSARGDVNGTLTIALPNTDGRYTDLVSEGDVLDLEIGALTSNNLTEYFRLMRCVVTGSRSGIADGDLRMTVTATPLTLAKLEDLTHPFSLTLRGRESLRDSLATWDNFERAQDEGYVTFPLAVDFWDSGDETKPQKNEAPYDETKYDTGDLKQALNLVAYPEITSLPFDIYLYGWSRSGSNTPYEGGDGDLPSNLNAPNDRVYCRLYISQGGSDAEDLVVNVQTTEDGSEDHFPQTWYKTDTGSYPVVLKAQTSDGLHVGDRIIRMGMVFVNDRTPDTAETLFYGERIEIPDVSMRVDSFDETWQPVAPPSVDKTVVILTSLGIFYTENLDVDSPTWHDFNEDLTDKSNIDSLTYDETRGFYYATGPSGIWKAEGLGEAWELVFDSDSAVDKINSAGYTCGGSPIPTGNSRYYSIYCDRDGVVYCYGGADDPTTNCNAYKSLFVSLNGLATIDPKGAPHPSFSAMPECGQFLRLEDSSRVLMSFNCAAGVGRSRHLKATDDKGATIEAVGETASFTTGVNGIVEVGSGRVIYYHNSDDDLWISDEGDGTDFTKFTAILPDDLRGVPGGTEQSIASSPLTRIKLIASLEASNPSNIALSEDNGDTWSVVGANIYRVYCVEASRVSDQAWLAGGQKDVSSCTITYTEDDGATWTDKSGNLSTVAGGNPTVQRFAAVFAGPPSDEEEADEGQELLRVGIPVIYFAQKPYYAINAVAAAKYYLSGEHAWGGVCILASDGSNYIAARTSPDTVKLVKVRDGLETVLASAANAFPLPYGWIMLRYLDGKFEVRIKNARLKTWPDPLIEYEWGELDGALLTDGEVSHVGLYALKDAPYVRICGLDLDMTRHAGIMPLAHKWDEFDASGTVRIEDAQYTYASKVDAATVMGPYQGRNVGGPYAYSNNGAHYKGNAAEFTRFEWVSNADHKDDFDGEHLATDTGVVWEINAVDYHPFIFTEGVQVFLKNRGRFFSADADGDVIGMDISVWVTHALKGLVQVSGDETTHAKGAIAYLVNDCSVRVYEFAAAAGDDDLTDRDAIDRLSRIARGVAMFPG